MEKIDSILNFSNRIPKSLLNGLFLISFLLLSFSYDYHEMLFERPQGVHVWRQTDCTSMALNYYQNDAGFFRPETHYRFNEEAQAIGEFPLLYYFIGQLYKVFGFHEWIYRALWWIIAFLGAYCMYLLAYEVLKMPIMSMVIGLFLFVSPAIAYYSINFLPDPSALYFTCIALYFLIRSDKKESLSLYVFSILMITLAGLLKVSALLLPLSLLGVFFLKNIYEKKPQNSLYLLSGISFVLLINFFWYRYASAFNIEHHTTYFLTGIAPIWNMTKDQIIEVTGILYGFRIHELYSKYLFIILFGVLTYAIFRSKDHRRWIILFVLLIIVGLISFVLLFYDRFKYHDYYLITNTIFVPIFLILIFKLLKDSEKSRRFATVIQVLVCALFIRNYFIADQFVYDRFTYPENEEIIHRGYNDLEPYLRSLGIEPEDIVISIPDESPNITLYLMNQTGWSNLYHNPYKPAEMDYFIKVGAKYLIVGDRNLLQEEYLHDYINRPIGQFKDISIFRLMP